MARPFDAKRALVDPARLTALWSHPDLRVDDIAAKFGVSRDIIRHRANALKLPSRARGAISHKRPISETLSEVKHCPEREAAYVNSLIRQGGFVWREVVGGETVEHRFEVAA